LDESRRRRVYSGRPADPAGEAMTDRTIHSSDRRATAFSGGKLHDF
jgi:hypothetical protein